LCLFLIFLFHMCKIWFIRCIKTNCILRTNTGEMIILNKTIFIYFYFNLLLSNYFIPKVVVSNPICNI
jgi:hypothetical protein